MARIRSFKHVLGPGRVHPTEVDAEWSVFSGGDGTTWLQLSTLGSKERKSHPKVSQTIQLNNAAAKSLQAILLDAFGPVLQ
jgi:hypothetical protein